MSISNLLRAEQLKEPLQMEMPAIYDLLRTLPDGIVVRFGRRIRVREDAFLNWLANRGK